MGKFYNKTSNHMYTLCKEIYKQGKLKANNYLFTYFAFFMKLRFKYIHFKSNIEMQFYLMEIKKEI